MTFRLLARRPMRGAEFAETDAHEIVADELMIDTGYGVRPADWLARAIS